MSTPAATRPHSSSTPSRWSRTAPIQRRGHETAERFAAATEALLRTRPFEEISIQDIVRMAGRPTGSFYARFASKEALLPFLYQRYHEDLEPRFAARLGRVDWDSLDLGAASAALVDVLIAQYTERRWLIRALALFTRMRPEALPDDLVRRRRRVFDHAVQALIRHRRRITHDDAEAAIRFGVYLVCAVAREKLLFGEAPHSRVTPMTRATLRAELVRTLYAYLTTRTSR